MENLTNTNKTKPQKYTEEIQKKNTKRKNELKTGLSVDDDGKQNVCMRVGGVEFSLGVSCVRTHQQKH